MTARQLGVVLSGIALIALAAEAGVRAIYVPKPHRDFTDAAIDLRSSDPDAIVVGSSHGWTFHVLASEVANRSLGTVHVISAPLDGGKWHAEYQAFAMRLKPILERESIRSRRNLRHLIIIGNAWDSIGPAMPTYPSLSARAWRLDNYLSDVLTHGLTDHNRNYIRSRLSRGLSFSALARARLEGLSSDFFVAALHGLAKTERAQESRRQRLAEWQRFVEDDAGRLFHPDQMAALQAMVDFGKKNEISVTLVLFPLMPATVTDRARTGAIALFSHGMQQFAAKNGIRLVDLQLMPGVTDEDFRNDFDHMTEEGGRRFSSSVLDGHLKFLLEAREAKARCRGGS